MTSPRRALARALSTAVVALLTVAILPALASYAATPGAVERAGATGGAWLRVSDSTVRPGQRIVLRGRVPARGARPVVLEQRRTQRWVPVARTRTTPRGLFRFTRTAGQTSVQYRARAPRQAQRRGAPRPAITPSRGVRVERQVRPPTPVRPPTEDNLATTVSASSEGAGADATQVLGRPLRREAPGWQAQGEGVGAWIELGLDQARTVRRLVVERGVGVEGGVRAGYLTFDDGSMLQVRLDPSDPVTVLPFTPRSAASVRFTVTEVDGPVAGLRSLRVQGTTSPDDVLVTSAPDGDTADTARLTSSAGEPSALVDGGVGTVGRSWSTTSAGGSWVQLAWDRPRELTTVALAGEASPARLKSATLEFSDGATLPVGAVTADATRPTVVSFMPRVARWVRLRLDSVSTAGELRLAEITALQPQAPALTAPGGTEAPFTDRSVDCTRTARPADAVGLQVLCPTNGDRAGNRARLRLALAPSYDAVRVSAWSADGAAPALSARTLTPDANGLVDVDLDVSSLPRGPLTVGLWATSPRAETKKAFFGLFHDGGYAASQPSTPDPARGRTLVWSEEFDRSLSTTKSTTVTDYFAGKPEYWGPGEFSSAIFANPDRGFGNVRTLPEEGVMRISTQPNPPGFTDPNGWGRTRLGGMVASARPGGSGFAAQYGYFEARMLLPAGVGAWPAFWMLPTDNLVSPQDVVAEIDALEHYGHYPMGTCHTTHSHGNPAGGGAVDCGWSRWPDEQSALRWHTFGAAVDPDGIRFFVDGVQVARAPQVGGGADPMFWMVNLALGGGYPIKLEANQDRVDLYVDHVRVYV